MPEQGCCRKTIIENIVRIGFYPDSFFKSLFILKFENGETFQTKGRSIELQREDFGLITENHFMIVSAVEKPSHSNENMTFLLTLDNDHQLSLEHVPLGYSSDDLVGTVVERVGVDEYFVYDNPGYSIFTYRIEELGIESKGESLSVKSLWTPNQQQIENAVTVIDLNCEDVGSYKRILEFTLTLSNGQKFYSRYQHPNWARIGDVWFTVVGAGTRTNKFVNVRTGEVYVDSHNIWFPNLSHRNTIPKTWN